MDQPHRLTTITSLRCGAVGEGVGGPDQQPNLEGTADFPAETYLPRTRHGSFGRSPDRGRGALSVHDPE